MRIAMITATPQSVREGSGTYVAEAVLRHGLERLGHAVRIVAPDAAQLIKVLSAIPSPTGA